MGAFDGWSDGLDVDAWVRGCVKVAWFVGKACKAPAGEKAGVEFK